MTMQFADSMAFPALTDTLDDIPSEIEADHILSGLIGSNPGDVTVEHISQPDGMPGMLETIYGPSTVDPAHITQLPDVLTEGQAVEAKYNQVEKTYAELLHRMAREAHGTPVRLTKPTRLSTARVLIPLNSVAPPILVSGSDQRRYKVTFMVAATGTDVAYMGSSQGEANDGVGFPIFNGMTVEATDDIYVGAGSANAASVTVSLMVERWA